MKNHGLQSAIGFFEEVLTEQQCTKLLEAFSHSDQKATGQVIGPDGKPKEATTKVSIDLDIAELPEDLRDEVHDGVTRAVKEYLDQFPSLGRTVFRTMGYKIQCYEKGKGHFVWHSDATTPETYRRQIAMVLYLNTVENGGETEFYYQNLLIQPQRGCCIFFPPFWTHSHRGKVPLSGDKYVITTFYERTFSEPS